MKTTTRISCSSVSPLRWVSDCFFAATRAADRWKNLSFDDFRRKVGQSLTPQALSFPSVCGTLQKMCRCSLIVVIDEVSKLRKPEFVSDALHATELAFEVPHVAPPSVHISRARWAARERKYIVKIHGRCRGVSLKRPPHRPLTRALPHDA